MLSSKFYRKETWFFCFCIFILKDEFCGVGWRSSAVAPLFLLIFNDSLLPSLFRVLSDVGAALQQQQQQSNSAKDASIKSTTSLMAADQKNDNTAAAAGPAGGSSSSSHPALNLQTTTTTTSTTSTTANLRDKSKRRKINFFFFDFEGIKIWIDFKVDLTYSLSFYFSLTNPVKLVGFCFPVHFFFFN